LKKCISILLISFLIINSGGFVVIFYQAQHAAKAQMRRSILEGDYTADEVVKFRLVNELIYCDADGYSWKDTHEFEYKGVMYDIIRMVKDNDHVILYCLNDISEAKIKAAFHNELNDVANGRLNNSRYSTSLLNIISQALCLNSFALKSPEKQRKFTPECRQSISPFIKQIPSPPPKAA
jgi:hypothetical protein